MKPAQVALGTFRCLLEGGMINYRWHRYSLCSGAGRLEANAFHYNSVISACAPHGSSKPWLPPWHGHGESES